MGPQKHADTVAVLGELVRSGLVEAAWTRQVDLQRTLNATWRKHCNPVRQEYRLKYVAGE